MQPIAQGSVDPTPEYSECCWPECEKTVEAGGPPLCERHFLKVGLEFLRERHHLLNDYLADAVMGVRVSRDLRSHYEEARQHQERRRAAYAEQSQVYYVRIHDHVKIGYTVNLKQRLSQLRVSPDALLATEPGARDLEQQRHAEFAAERIGRREDFNPSRRLLAHIEAIKAEHGEPNLTGYFYVP